MQLDRIRCDPGLVMVEIKKATPSVNVRSSPRSTNGATKRSRSTKTRDALSPLNTPNKPDENCSSRYRTQEVAGSSPASSTS